MGKANLSVCIICKNEEIQIENCLKSIRDYVEEIVVVDTGSTDKTPEIAKKYADKFESFSKCNDSQGRIEDFSMARQRSFDLATKKWVMWIDGDDQLEGAQNLEVIINQFDSLPQDVMLMSPYEYSHDANGNPTCVHYRERIINNNKNFNWYGPVHEVLMPKNPTSVFAQKVDSIRFIHKRTAAKIMEPGRNLRILKKLYQKIGDSDARQLYYLGLEYSNNNDIENSNKFLKKYVALSGWDDEKCLAYLKISTNYLSQNKLDESIDYALQACKVKENWGECYFAVARGYYFLAIKNDINSQRHFERCVHFAKIGLSCPPTDTVLFINPLERSVDIHRYLNVALSKIGKVKEALDSANEAIKIDTTDPQLKHNKNCYENHLSRLDINKLLNNMVVHGGIDKDQYASIMTIFDHNILSSSNILSEDLVWLAAKDLRDEGKYVYNSYIKNKEKSYVFTEVGANKADRLKVIFYIGDGLEPWTPVTVKKNGIGGSETMALEMAKRLAKLGHKVSVYNNCGQFGKGIYEGVEYYKSSHFINLECDVLIVSRMANMLDPNYNIKAKLKLLWCHDVVAVNAQHKLLLEADKILALSNWHKQNLIKEHNLNSDHVLVTRNGFNEDNFGHPVKRDKYKCVNGSSPDRSWAVLLRDNVWGEIKRQVPEATLHLYYGFDNWEKIAPFRQGQLETINSLKSRIDELKDQGVVFHGRMSQEELAKEYLSASVALYPTYFTETSCITAMEYQAAGLKIISSSIAALNETVADRGVLLDEDWTSKEYQDEFVKESIRALKSKEPFSPSKLNRQGLIDYANNNFSLSKLADEWSQMFYDLIDKLDESPLVVYNPTESYK